jgi:hypothetical protein
MNLPPALLIVLAVLAAVALVLGLARLRHVVTRRRVVGRFDQFKEHVIDLRQRVEALKERHQLLPAANKDFSAPMAGATLALYQRLQQDFDNLLDDWRRRMELWDRVEALIAAEKPLGAGRLHEAERHLDKLGSFDGVDAASRDCVAQLDRLEHGHERARTLLAQAAETTGQLRQQIEAVRALPLPTGSYEAELERCGAGVAQGQAALPADPVGAVTALEGAAQKMAALDDWMQEVVRLFGRAGKAHDELEEVTRTAAARRAGGLLLTEPDGNPDPIVARGQVEQAAALEALRRADAKAAAEHVKQAFALSKEAGEVIERQAAAQALCAKEVPARRAEAQRLRQAAAAEAQRHELERDFAGESWREVADHLPRARRLLDSAEALLQEAASASAAAVQHYFRASGLLDQVRQQQDEARGLLQAVGQSLRQLTELRQECQRRRQEVSDLARRVQTFLGTHQGVVRSGARSHFDAAEEGWRQVRGQAEGPRPNWTAVRQRIDEAQKAYAAALKEAEEDVRRHEQLMTKLAEVGREAERVELFLRQHYHSRPRAQQCQRTAADALDRVRRESTGRPADWADLLRQLEEAAKGLSQAEQLAKEDVRLAQRAEGAIAEAERELEQARGHSGADVGRAADLLTQARRRLAGQEYEQAAEQAAAAGQAARQAHDEAARRVQQEQQRLEQERQRQQAIASPAPLMAPAPPPGPLKAEADDPSPPPEAEEFTS